MGNLGVWEVLDTPEKRRAVALALADRKMQGDKRCDDKSYTPMRKGGGKTAYGTERNRSNKNDPDSGISATNQNNRSNAGQDGMYQKDISLRDKDANRLFYKNKDGSLEPTEVNQRPTRHVYVDHHRHDYHTIDGQEYGGKEVDGENGEKKWQAPLIARREKGKRVTLKVSPHGEKPTSDDDNEIRSNGWATGRYRGLIRGKLKDNEVEDNKYFLRNPEAKSKVDAEYASKRGHSDPEELSDRADDHEFGRPLPKAQKEFDAQRKRIKQIVKPSDTSADPEVKKKTLGKATHADSTEYRDSGKSTRDSQKAKDYNANLDLEQELEKARKRNAHTEKTTAAQQAKLDMKTDSQEKPKSDGPDLASYNKELLALGNLRGADRDKAVNILKNKYGIKESLQSIEETLRPEFKRLLEDMRTMLIKAVK